MIGIYKITSPSGRIYIGSSINILRRKREYKNHRVHGQPRLLYSFNKYGFDRHVFEVIYECGVSKLFKMEYYYGALFDALGKNGLNCRLPKIDDLSICMSDETKSKISNAKKGMKRPDLSLINKSRAGIKASAEAKNKMRVAQLGRKHPQEVKNKIRLAHIGKPKSAEHRINLSEKRKLSGKKVVNTETGQVFINLKSASLSMGKHDSFLSHQFKRNVYWGFKLLNNLVT